eukprot:scaffold27568_cov129-Isochrysis_galbana.AAC.2
MIAAAGLKPRRHAPVVDTCRHVQPGTSMTPLAHAEVVNRWQASKSGTRYVRRPTVYRRGQSLLWNLYRAHEEAERLMCRALVARLNNAGRLSHGGAGVSEAGGC